MTNDKMTDDKLGALPGARLAYEADSRRVVAKGWALAESRETDQLFLYRPMKVFQLTERSKIGLASEARSIRTGFVIFHLPFVIVA
jgi:hypothetical protein